ncbi:MAG: DUF3991 and toprim domain-containing protein [Eubacteriales bacterium]|nr:DUF3991 and toprim domain-containing protein [Eubacteriales bacterium]HCG34941.1 hypothetical protein [Clostridiales bacterium]
MPYIHFTPEQIEQAQNADLEEFLRSRGEKLKRSGSEWEWRDGSAKVTIRQNQWYHHYEQTGGKAIDFVRRFYNLDFPDAVQMLLGSGYIPLAPSATVKQQKSVKPFVLPEANSDMRRVFAYLLKQRFIDRDIIHYFAHNGMLYEDTEHHNAVFVGKDENGILKHAHKRSTYQGSSYKGNIEGCNADYSFHHTGTSNRLYVFEAPIDLLSYLTLHSKNWEQHSYVSLCCVADHAAVKVLQLNPNIDTVMLCLDHDAAGIEACYRIAEHLHEIGDYKVYRESPQYKDWNEMLKAKNGIIPISASEHPNMEYVKDFCNSLADEKIEWSEEYEQLKRYPQKLMEQTTAKLSGCIGKLKNISPENTISIQERTLEMTRCALSFAIIRDRQFGVKLLEDWYTDKMLKMYKPNHDRNGYANRINDMEKKLQDFIRNYSADKILTKSEAAKQIENMLEIGLDAVRLNAFVSLQEQEQTEKFGHILE